MRRPQTRKPFPAVGQDVASLFPLPQGDFERTEKALTLLQPIIHERGGGRTKDLSTSNLFSLLKSRLFVRSDLVTSFAANHYLKFRDLLACVPSLKDAHEQISHQRGKVTKFPKLSFGKTFKRPDSAERIAQKRAFCSESWHAELAKLPVAEGIRRVLDRLTATTSLLFEPRWLHEKLRVDAQQIASEIAAAGYSSSSIALAIGLDLHAHRGKHPAAKVWHNPEHFVYACIGLIRSLASQERRRSAPRMAKSKGRRNAEDSASG